MHGSKLFLNMAVTGAMFLGLPLLGQAQSKPTTSFQLEAGVGAVQYPQGWSPRHYANMHEIWNATPEKLAAMQPDERDDVARVGTSITPCANHAEAVQRLREIEAEWGMTSTYVVVGSWPALQRRVLVPKPQEGAESGSSPEWLVMLTTAVAIDNSVVRIDGFAPETASPTLIGEMEGIVHSLRPATSGDPRRGLGEVQQLQKTPSLRMPLALPQATSSLGAIATPNDLPAVSPVTTGTASNLGTLNLQIGSESEIAVSANGTDIVVAQQCSFRTSTDGGATFAFSGGAPGRCTGGDSSVAFGKSGNFYWSTIASVPANCPAATPNCNDAQQIARSTNNGQSFSFVANPVDCLGGTPSCGFGNVPDQEHIAADRFNSSGSNQDQIYLVFRQGFGYGITCSTDNGANWTAVTYHKNGSTDFPRITVSQNGTVFVVTNNGNNIELDSFGQCQNGLTQNLNHVAIATGINQVTCPVAGLDRCNDGNILSSHTVAVDDTNANHLYAAYAVNTVAPAANASFPGNENILVRESTNGGANWSAPVQINQGTGGTGGRRFQPWVCVTQGTAFVSWYDRRASTSTSNDLTDYYSSSAFDSGSVLTPGTDFRINGAADPQCASGWPCQSRSQYDSRSCSTQPQNGGICRHSPNNNTDSKTPCNFASPVCPATETCQGGSGCPKYADYTGNACLLGRLYNVWPSATNQPGATPTGGSIASFFAETAVAPTATKTTYTGPITSPYLGTVLLSATLVLQGTSVPVTTQLMTFTLGTQSCTGTTNASGAASCSLALTQAPGLYTVTASFAGFGNYLPSSDSKPFSIVGPPSISKDFVPNKILPGSTTTLKFSITNPNSFVSLTGVSFTDSLPAGLLVSTPNALTSSCGGSPSAVPGSATISLTAATIVASASCTITVNVTASNLDAIYQNMTSAVTSIEGGTGNIASAIVIVAHPPVLKKTFSALAIPQGASAGLTFTLVNPNQAVTLTGISFTDTLPAGLVVSTPNGLTTICAGTVTATAGSSTISASGVPLAPGANCTITVFVTATASGVQVNTTSTISSDQTVPGDPATATITVGDVFEVSYAANLTAGDAQINITNTGVNGASLNGPGIGSPIGNICVNVYAFAPDEQLISCCSCLLTPNGLESLSVDNDIVSNTFTGVKPDSVVVKLVSTLAGAGGSGTSCTNSAAAPTPLAPGLQAWRTSLHAAAAGGFSPTETQFTQSTLSAAELASVANRCTNIIGNGSSFGICKSCRAGGLGAQRQ